MHDTVGKILDCDRDHRMWTVDIHKKYDCAASVLDACSIAGSGRLAGEMLDILTDLERPGGEAEAGCRNSC